MQVSPFDVVSGAKTLRGFILYRWLEGPHKRATLDAVMQLLVDKVIVPHSGAPRRTRCAAVPDACNVYMYSPWDL